MSDLFLLACSLPKAEFVQWYVPIVCSIRQFYTILSSDLTRIDDRRGLVDLQWMSL